MRKQGTVPRHLDVFTIFVINISLFLATASSGGANQTPGPQEQDPKAPATNPSHSTAPSGRELKLAGAPFGPIAGPQKGTLLLCSLASPEIRARFLKLAGGADARIVMVVRQIPPGVDPVEAGPRAAKAWGVRDVTFWRLTDRRSAEDKAFIAAIHAATGVWLPGGKPPEYLGPLLDSTAQEELAKLLARAGVIGGESAGAVIQSSFVALPPGGPYAGPALQGLGFARNLVIFPHFIGETGKFPMEFCERIIADLPGLAGLALPDGSAVVVQGQIVEVLGKAPVRLFRRLEDGRIETTTYAPATSFVLTGGAATNLKARTK